MIRKFLGSTIEQFSIEKPKKNIVYHDIEYNAESKYFKYFNIHNISYTNNVGEKVFHGNERKFHHINTIFPFLQLLTAINTQW